MSKKALFALALVAIASLSGSVLAGEKKEEHKHEHKGPHGGALLEVGEEVAHVELVHDEKAGKITLYILGKDGKSAVALKEAPKVNVKGKDKKKQLETTAVGASGSEYSVTDDVLKADPLEGRIVLTLEGKKYNVDMKEHDHDH